MISPSAQNLTYKAELQRDKVTVHDYEIFNFLADAVTYEIMSSSAVELKNPQLLLNDFKALVRFEIGITTSHLYEERNNYTLL